MGSIEQDALAAAQAQPSQAVQVLTPEAEQPAGISEAALLKLVSTGDLSSLTESQRYQFYLHRCRQAGLDPGTNPFQFITMNGKLVLYAKREAADQICANHGFSISIKETKTENDILFVRVGITDPKTGRESEDLGAVYLKGLTGEGLSNAYMKAFTKAKRRAVLSFAGLGMLDESEVASVRAAQGDVRNLPSPSPSILPQGKE